jgi:cold shock CspA family protein
MSNGTVMGFNRTIGAGYIRTDDGESMLFRRSAVKESDPSLIREGERVCVDVLESQYGFTASQVRAFELTEMTGQMTC